MLIGKKGYYYLKVILFFAFSRKESFAIKELSKRLAISEKVLEQVLLSLKNKGILASKRGPQGGYRLSKDVSDLTVMDIVEMTDKKLAVLPIDPTAKKNVLEDVLTGIELEVKDQLTARFKELKVKDLVTEMKEKIAEAELSYMI